MLASVKSMTNKEVVKKLAQLKYHKLCESYVKVISNKNIEGKTFNELFAMMLAYEEDLAQINKTKILLKQTNLVVPSSLDDIDYSSPRNLKSEVINNLRTLDFIKNAHNIIVSGATGCGKTYLGTAFGFEAVMSHFEVCYYRIPFLLDEISLRRDKGTYRKLMRKLKKLDLLILDDLGLSNLSIQESREILEILEQRNKHCSTILISQLPFDKWYEMFKDPTLADAIIDRIAYNSYKIELKGDSMRKTKNSLQND